MTKPTRAAHPARCLSSRRSFCLRAASAIGANWAPIAYAQAAAQGTAAAEAAASGAAAAASAPNESIPPDPGRLALVIGNRQYPSPFDLPPIHKNAHDVAQALRRRGFHSEVVLDANLAQVRQAVDGFSRKVQAAPADSTALFYFSGHGVQVVAENLLIGAGLNPSAGPDALLGGSVVLTTDVIERLPRRPQGLTIAIVDACRTDLRNLGQGTQGLNQVEAPPGCLIAFSTGAGRPAISPAVETQNTFYTASLVKLLSTASDELSFSDLFRLVKLDVQRTMLNHRLEPIRRFAQYPFIAENTQVSSTLAPLQWLQAQAATRERFRSEREEADFRRLQELVWAPDVIRLADEFMKEYRDSKLAGSVEVAREGAVEAAAILARNDVQLYRRSFDAATAPDEVYRADLLKAGRGDKDAAARIGRRWATKAVAGPEVSRYDGWMQYAAELGTGIASYELALHYRRIRQPQPAARWEARARELGYTPPASLEHTRK